MTSEPARRHTVVTDGCGFHRTVGYRAALRPPGLAFYLDSAGLCRTLPDSAGLCRTLPDSAGLCRTRRMMLAGVRNPSVGSRRLSSSARRSQDRTLGCVDLFEGRKHCGKRPELPRCDVCRWLYLDLGSFEASSNTHGSERRERRHPPIRRIATQRAVAHELHHLDLSSASSGWRM
jgi:hypothetical protein